MNVELISYTADAENLLIFTKHTRRLEVDKAVNMTQEEKAEELKYVLNTISGPWEFINYTFMIKDVTRAFTHELVRSRVGTSFAQESMRFASKENFSYRNEISEEEFPEAFKSYEGIMDDIDDTYHSMIVDGVPIQEARGVLPTNILTNIVMNINLRALSTMLNLRLCLRTAGEYQQVAKEFRELVMKVHPWTEPVLVPFCIQHGICCFPMYNECPIKEENPDLQRNDDLVASTRKSWHKVAGLSKQPT